MKKNRVYVVFDHLKDMLTFSEIKSKCCSDIENEMFFTVDMDLKNGNLGNSLKAALKSASVVLVLVDDNSKYLGGQYKTEIALSIDLEKPIIVVNINGERSLDIENCPIELRDKFALHISKDYRIVNCAIRFWPLYYENNLGRGLRSMYLDDAIYHKYNL